jgi:hypothetical protein
MCGEEYEHPYIIKAYKSYDKAKYAAVEANDEEENNSIFYYVKEIEADLDE